MTLHVALLVVGVIATVIGVAVLAARLPVAKGPPAPRPRTPGTLEPTQLLRIERIVRRSHESSTAAHTLLRPLLSDIAEALLARRGVRLHHDHDEVRRLLGPQAWELVRPNRPQPDGRGAGVGPGDLEAVLDRLEAL